MTLRDFARQHRLKTTVDECGDPVILGRIGSSNIYEYADDVLGVMFITDTRKARRTGLWNKFKVACLAAGMTFRQSGDAEGSFTFDPENEQVAKVAIRGIRARVKRQISPEQAMAGAARLLAARNARNSGSRPQQERIISG